MSDPAGPSTPPRERVGFVEPDLLTQSVNEQHLSPIVCDMASSQNSDDTCAIEVSNSVHRRPSLSSPRVGRSTTFALPDEDDSRSRRSSSTDSSESRQPTSVDAFASRRRTGTIDSTPDLDAIRRTLSASQRIRRPAKPDRVVIESPVIATPVEEDVCFPPVPDARACKVDYDDLEELIDLQEPQGSSGQASAGARAESSNRARRDSNLAPIQPVPPGGPNDEDKEKNELDEDDDVDGPSPAQLIAVPQPPGKVDCRYTFFSSELDDIILSSTFAGLLAGGEKAQDLFEPAISNGGVWWLDMLNPSKEAVGLICNAFSVHPLTREDIMTQETREKVELFKSYYFVCFRTFYSMDKESAEYMDPVNVYAVVFREGLLTFSFCDNPHARNVRTRIGKLRDYLQLSSDWICYALIDDIVDTFAPVIRDIEVESDLIEDEVLIARSEDSRAMLQQITICRKKVMQLLRLLGGKADVIKGFAKRCNSRYEVAPRGDVGLYLSDIQDHVVTMMGNLAHFEKMLGRSHSNYLAQLSIDNLQQGNVVNATLGKVTLIATILVPLNLVTGMFGMNVPVPGKDSESLGWFFGIIGFIACVVCFAICWAKRMKMI